MPEMTDAVHYDPYDADIDDDPYPAWRRLRDEAPLYHNEEHDFYALSRWDDVEAALLDWDTYRSGQGTILDIIQVGVEIPPGILLFEDPPIHDAHRALLSRVFTPRRMRRSSRSSAATAPRPSMRWSARDEFDVIAELGSMPMRTIGLLFGIPEAGPAGRSATTPTTTSRRRRHPTTSTSRSFDEVDRGVRRLRRLAGREPSDDLMTELLHAEVEEPTAARRSAATRWSPTRSMVAGAGNETATRLIGFTDAAARRAPRPAPRCSSTTRR